MKLPRFSAEASMGKPTRSYGYYGGPNAIAKGDNVMEQTEVNGQSGDQHGNVNEAAAIAPSSEGQHGTTLTPQAESETCSCGAPGEKCTCGAEASSDLSEASTPSYVYALGRVDPRFPSLEVEKEFAQATGRAETAGLTDQQVLRTVLAETQNRYLLRQLCWVLTIEGLETYLLQPRDLMDLDMLVEAVRSTPGPADVDVVIGWRGPLAPPEMCNGLIVPLVVFDQIYSFDRGSLIKAIPRPEKMSAKQFEPVAEELFDRIMQMTDNAGATDEHRALNYLSVRYPAIYTKAAEMFARDFSLTAVAVHPSPLSGTRSIVEVIFSYTHRETDFTEKYFVRVDVTGEWPFLVTKLSPYYDR